jgi:hypothetical protein
MGLRPSGGFNTPHRCMCGWQPGSKTQRSRHLGRALSGLLQVYISALSEVRVEENVEVSSGLRRARSIKPLEGSRSRLRRTHSMGIVSIFDWKHLPEAEFGKNVGIDGHQCEGSCLYYSGARRLVDEGGSSDACVYTREAPAARSSVVLTSYPEVNLPIADHPEKLSESSGWP